MFQETDSSMFSLGNLLNMEMNDCDWDNNFDTHFNDLYDDTQFEWSIEQSKFEFCPESPLTLNVFRVVFNQVLNIAIKVNKIRFYVGVALSPSFACSREKSFVFYSNTTRYLYSI